MRYFFGKVNMTVRRLHSTDEIILYHVQYNGPVQLNEELIPLKKDDCHNTLLSGDLINKDEIQNGRSATNHGF